jgi:transcriptional regulator with XRE-family HTH domain
MIIRKLRLERSWSQQQLAEYSGLSIRTIQRLEKGQAPSEESAKCLAAVFEVNSDDLLDCFEPQPKKEVAMNPLEISIEEKRVMRQVREIKEFYGHLSSYCIVIPALWAFNLLSSTEYLWAIWPTLGWGIGLSSHAIGVFKPFNLFGPEWEKREIEKRLNR